QIVLGIGPAFMGDLAVIAQECPHVWNRLQESPHRRDRNERIRPTVETVPVLGWDAKHLRNNRRRQRQGIVAYDIHVPAMLDLIEELISQLLNTLSHLLDQPGGKRFVDERPQSSMDGWILVEHVALESLEHLQLLKPGLLGELFRRAGIAAVLDE